MEDLDFIKIGNFIATLRKKKNLTQVELGELIGSTGKPISKWETGNSFPDIIYHQKLCEVLEISMEELYAGEYDIAKRNQQKRRKIINISLIVSVCILVPLSILLGTYFLLNYRYPKMYYLEETELVTANIKIAGVYVDSRKNKLLYIGKFEFLNADVSSDDMISIDFYSEDELVYHHNSLEFSIINFNKDINLNAFKVIVEITTIDNKEYNYEIDLNFREVTTSNLDNNYEVETVMSLCNESDTEKVLIADGFEKTSKGVLIKKYKNKKRETEISFMLNDGKISYVEIGDGVYKNIFYYKNLNSMEIYIYHDNENVHTLVEKYTYNYTNEKLICDVGVCSTIDEVKELMDPYIILLNGE